LEDIVSVAGVDAICLGPADLSFALGVDFLTGPHPIVDAAIERMLSVCRAHGVACGLGDSSPEVLRSWRDRGCTFLTYGPDYALLVKAVTEGLRTLRSSP
jgi:4-hydroxy-2-oxoheptanedioate aldolase